VPVRGRAILTPVRHRTPAVIAVAMLACGGPRGEVATPEPSAPSRAAETEVEDDRDAVPRDELSVRVELEHPMMTAGADPMTEIEARLDAIVYVVSHAATERELTVPVPASHELEWRVVDASGARWEVTFLPPPVPRPGGPPRTTVRVPAGGEARLADLYGVSGFRREGAPPDQWTGTPPAGTYSIVISGFRLGGEPLTAPPVQLVVR